MEFYCKQVTNEGINEWKGAITNLGKHNNCYGFWIRSRSSIMVIFGVTTRGGFTCIPDFNVGCHLVNLKNKFWNTEQLVKILGEVDGITVASASFKLSNEINI